MGVDQFQHRYQWDQHFWILCLPETSQVSQVVYSLINWWISHHIKCRHECHSCQLSSQFAKLYHSMTYPWTTILESYREAQPLSALVPSSIRWSASLSMFVLTTVLAQTLRKVTLLRKLQMEPKVEVLDTGCEYVQHKVQLWHQNWHFEH